MDPAQRSSRPARADQDFTFAGNGRPVTGDWDGDGRTGVGWFNAGTWTIRNIGSTTSDQLHIRREWLPADLGTERLMTAIVDHRGPW